MHVYESCCRIRHCLSLKFPGEVPRDHDFLSFMFLS